MDSIVTLADKAINEEMLVRKHPIPLSKKPESEIEVTPTSEFTRVQVAAPQLSVFRLWGGEHIRLIIGLEDEELPVIVLQDLHHPFLALSGIFWDVHGRVLLVIEFITNEERWTKKGVQIWLTSATWPKYVGRQSSFNSSLPAERALLRSSSPGRYTRPRPTREIRSKRHLRTILGDVLH
jgi:hypothetical protein